MTRRLLVVEDDAGIRDLLRDWLASTGEVVFATSQSECYAALQADSYDVILLDLRLPKKPGDMYPANEVGIDTVQEIRKRCIAQRGTRLMLPVLIMTAHGADAPTAVQLMRCGANDYLVKPFQAQQLVEAIRRAFAADYVMVPQANIVGSMIRLVFDPKAAVVHIESFEYRGVHHELLSVLREVHDGELAKRRLPEDHEGIPGEALAKRLRIGGKAVRQRVVRFRRDVQGKFATLGRVLSKNDIIENLRQWDGYRLNPRVVQVFGGESSERKPRPVS
jgi:DNA-binding response OmpR family regulator